MGIAYRLPAADHIVNAASDATYLMADVDVMATYTLFNINRTRLERLFHRVSRMHVRM